ncbi:hypothetical protein NDI85_19600 [Halomicroarcula sp. S1AR25-4]|uniref:hypothetical protein n=1 Tax=Haloarcula sp. S1AR25-4 TaxID=2950538 RepID=UPI00287702F7|nr:hypothetical protein [Halomicroarcula sp. S1AR25-4]MDS0279993.1 hypothetical protein [Halomicroarcula sp. S1AR25-4]
MADRQFGPYDLDNDEFLSGEATDLLGKFNFPDDTFQFGKEVAQPAIDDLSDFKVDTEANLPADPSTDSIAVVYDIDEIQRYDGNAWQTVANVSSGGASVSDDGSVVVDGPSDVDYTTALSAADDGDGTASIAVEQEAIEDWVAGLLSGQGNISLTYDDANDQLLVDTSALNEEQVEDAVAGLVSSSGNLAWSYDDANNTLTVSLSGPIEGVQIGTSANRSPAYFNTADASKLAVENSELASAGSRISLAQFHPQGQRAFSTTSTTYTSSVNQFEPQPTWDLLGPSNATTSVYWAVYVGVGSGETVDIRLFNADDNETIVERTGITSSGWRAIGPTDYRPQSDSRRIGIRAEIRTDPGSNSSTLTAPQMNIGLEL